MIGSCKVVLENGVDVSEIPITIEKNLLLSILVIAKYRVVVLCLSSWIIAGLSIGIINLEITTNPVELWASPNSRSRLEKDFFDNNFKPFYRTEQVFIKTVGIPEVSITFYQF